MAEKDITLEAVGEFPFTFYIEKAVPMEEGDELIIEGIASTTNIDHDNERMSSDALREMESMINEKSVPLRVEHSKQDSAVIGKVFKAWVDERNQLHIRASLDKSHPVSPILHHSMKSGVKMGLSVGGIVKRAVKEYADSVGKMVKTFYNVALSEVSVTPRPANYDSWVVAKSIAKDEVEADQFRDSGLYNQFLFENPKLDYLQVFAKSVPDKAWQKTANSPEFNNNEKNMSKKEEKDMKDDEKETDKSVSRGEFEGLKSMMAKGFDSVVALISKAMDSDAMDTNNPDKKKEKQVGDEAKKALDSDAQDQNAPDKKKEEQVGDQAKKSEDDEDDKKEKSVDDDKKDEEKEKTSKKDDSEDYKLEDVERSIKTMDSLTKRLEGMKKAEDKDEDEKKEKSADDDKKDEEKEKSEKDEDEDKEKTMHPLDQFVAAVTKTMEAMVDKMEKSGKTVPGFQKSFVDAIKNDPEMQVEIAKMAKIPGRKQSVAYGTPMMVTKDGKRYALSATEVGASVEKSSDSKKKTFADVYKSEFSSIKNQDE